MVEMFYSFERCFTLFCLPLYSFHISRGKQVCYNDNGNNDMHSSFSSEKSFSVFVINIMKLSQSQKTVSENEPALFTLN